MRGNRTSERWRYGLAAAGLLITGAAFLPGVFRDPGTGATVLSNPFRFLLTVGPGGGVVLLGWQLDRFGIDEDLYGRVVTWCVGGAGAFLTIILLVEGMELYSRGTVSLSAFALHLGIGIGALTGSVVGVSESRSVSRAREVARERAAATAAEAEREKLVFLNDLLRHHVLNGLQVIRGNAEILTDQHDPESAATIVRRSDAVSELVRNVRTLVDVEATPPERDIVDLSALLHSELAALREVHPEATVDAAVPDGLSVLAGPLLASVFENLLRNAIQHNDAAEPRVRVDVERSDGQVRVTVADNGPGIDDVSAAFELGDSGRRGLGLPLARRLVGRYDGEITVEGGAEGTRVEVVLPAADADREVRPASAAD